MGELAKKVLIVADMLIDPLLSKFKTIELRLNGVGQSVSMETSNAIKDITDNISKSRELLFGIQYAEAQLSLPGVLKSNGQLGKGLKTSFLSKSMSKQIQDMFKSISSDILKVFSDSVTGLTEGATFEKTQKTIQRMAKQMKTITAQIQAANTSAIIEAYGTFANGNKNDNLIGFSTNLKQRNRATTIRQLYVQQLGRHISKGGNFDDFSYTPSLKIQRNNEYKENDNEIVRRLGQFYRQSNKNGGLNPSLYKEVTNAYQQQQKSRINTMQKNGDIAAPLAFQKYRNLFNNVDKYSNADLLKQQRLQSSNAFLLNALNIRNRAFLNNPVLRNISSTITPELQMYITNAISQRTRAGVYSDKDRIMINGNSPSLIARSIIMGQGDKNLSLFTARYVKNHANNKIDAKTLAGSLADYVLTLVPFVSPEYMLNNGGLNVKNGSYQNAPNSVLDLLPQAYRNAFKNKINGTKISQKSFQQRKLTNEEWLVLQSQLLGDSYLLPLAVKAGLLRMNNGSLQRNEDARVGNVNAYAGQLMRSYQTGAEGPYQYKIDLTNPDNIGKVMRKTNKLVTHTLPAMLKLSQFAWLDPKYEEDLTGIGKWTNVPQLKLSNYKLSPRNTTMDFRSFSLDDVKNGQINLSDYRPWMSKKLLDKLTPEQREQMAGKKILTYLSLSGSMYQDTLSKLGGQGASQWQHNGLNQNEIVLKVPQKYHFGNTTWEKANPQMIQLFIKLVGDLQNGLTLNEGEGVSHKYLPTAFTGGVSGDSLILTRLDVRKNVEGTKGYLNFFYGNRPKEQRTGLWKEIAAANDAKIKDRTTGQNLLSMNGYDRNKFNVVVGNFKKAGLLMDGQNLLSTSVSKIGGQGRGPGNSKGTYSLFTYDALKNVYGLKSLNGRNYVVVPGAGILLIKDKNGKGTGKYNDLKIYSDTSLVEDISNIKSKPTYASQALANAARTADYRRQGLYLKTSYLDDITKPKWISAQTANIMGIDDKMATQFGGLAMRRLLALNNTSSAVDMLFSGDDALSKFVRLDPNINLNHPLAQKRITSYRQLILKGLSQGKLLAPLGSQYRMIAAFLPSVINKAYRNAGREGLLTQEALDLDIGPVAKKDGEYAFQVVDSKAANGSVSAIMRNPSTVGGVVLARNKLTPAIQQFLQNNGDDKSALYVPFANLMMRMLQGADVDGDSVLQYTNQLAKYGPSAQDLITHGSDLFKRVKKLSGLHGFSLKDSALRAKAAYELYVKTIDEIGKKNPGEGPSKKEGDLLSAADSALWYVLSKHDQSAMGSANGSTARATQGLLNRLAALAMLGSVSMYDMGSNANTKGRASMSATPLMIKMLSRGMSISDLSTFIGKGVTTLMNELGLLISRLSDDLYDPINGNKIDKANFISRYRPQDIGNYARLFALNKAFGIRNTVDDEQNISFEDALVGALMSQIPLNHKNDSAHQLAYISRMRLLKAKQLSGDFLVSGDSLVQLMNVLRANASELIKRQVAEDYSAGLLPDIKDTKGLDKLVQRRLRQIGSNAAINNAVWGLTLSYVRQSPLAQAQINAALALAGIDTKQNPNAWLSAIMQGNDVSMVMPYASNISFKAAKRANEAGFLQLRKDKLRLSQQNTVDVSGVQGGGTGINVGSAVINVGTASINTGVSGLLNMQQHPPAPSSQPATVNANTTNNEKPKEESKLTSKAWKDMSLDLKLKHLGFNPATVNEDERKKILGNDTNLAKRGNWSETEGWTRQILDKDSDKLPLHDVTITGNKGQTVSIDSNALQLTGFGTADLQRLNAAKTLILGGLSESTFDTVIGTLKHEAMQKYAQKRMRGEDANVEQIYTDSLKEALAEGGRLRLLGYTLGKTDKDGNIDILDSNKVSVPQAKKDKANKKGYLTSFAQNTIDPAIQQHQDITTEGQLYYWDESSKSYKTGERPTDTTTARGGTSLPSSLPLKGGFSHDFAISTGDSFDLYDYKPSGSGAVDSIFQMLTYASNIKKLTELLLGKYTEGTDEQRLSHTTYGRYFNMKDGKLSFKNGMLHAYDVNTGNMYNMPFTEQDVLNAAAVQLLAMNAKKDDLQTYILARRSIAEDLMTRPESKILKTELQQLRLRLEYLNQLRIKIERSELAYARRQQHNGLIELTKNQANLYVGQIKSKGYTLNRKSQNNGYAQDTWNRLAGTANSRNASIQNLLDRADLYGLNEGEKLLLQGLQTNINNAMQEGLLNESGMSAYNIVNGLQERLMSAGTGTKTFGKLNKTQESINQLSAFNNIIQLRIDNGNLTPLQISKAQLRIKKNELSIARANLLYGVLSAITWNNALNQYGLTQDNTNKLISLTDLRKKLLKFTSHYLSLKPSVGPLHDLIKRDKLKYLQSKARLKEIQKLLESIDTSGQYYTNQLRQVQSSGWAINNSITQDRNHYNTGISARISQDKMYQATRWQYYLNSKNTLDLKIGKLNTAIKNNQLLLKQALKDLLTLTDQNKRQQIAGNILSYRKQIQTSQQNVDQYEQQKDNAQKLQDKFKEGGSTVSAIMNTTAQSVSRMASSFGSNMFNKAISEVKKFVQQYDTAMTLIQMVTEKTDKLMGTLGDSLISKASSLKASVSDVTSAATSLYRQGLSDEETDDRLNTAIELSKVAGISSSESVKLITTAINTGLVDSALQAADVVAALGDSAATTAALITKGILKAGAAAALVGVTYELLVSMLTIITSKTQVSGSVAGTALQTVFSRMSRITSSSDIAYDLNGNQINGSQLARDMKSMAGIDLYKDGLMRDVFEVLALLASVWTLLGDVEQNTLSNELGGTRQFSNFSALMQGLSEDGGKTLQEYMSTAEGSSGTVLNKYSSYLDSLNASITGLQTAFDGLILTLNAGDTASGFIDTITQLVNGLTAANEASSGLVGSIAAIGAALTVVASLAMTNPYLLGIITAVGATAGIASLIGNNISTKKLVESYNTALNQLKSSLARTKGKIESVNDAIALAKKLNTKSQTLQLSLQLQNLLHNSLVLLDLTIASSFDFSTILTSTGDVVTSFTSLIGSSDKLATALSGTLDAVSLYLLKQKLLLSAKLAGNILQRTNLLMENNYTSGLQDWDTAMNDVFLDRLFSYKYDNLFGTKKYNADKIAEVINNDDYITGLLFGAGRTINGLVINSRLSRDSDGNIYYTGLNGEISYLTNHSGKRISWLNDKNQVNSLAIHYMLLDYVKNGTNSKYYNAAMMIQDAMYNPTGNTSREDALKTAIRLTFVDNYSGWIDDKGYDLENIVDYLYSLYTQGKLDLAYSTDQTTGEKYFDLKKVALFSKTIGTSDKDQYITYQLLQIKEKYENINSGTAHKIAQLMGSKKYKYNPLTMTYVLNDEFDDSGFASMSLLLILDWYNGQVNKNAIANAATSNNPIDTKYASSFDNAYRYLLNEEGNTPYLKFMNFVLQGNAGKIQNIDAIMSTNTTAAKMVSGFLAKDEEGNYILDQNGNYTFDLSKITLEAYRLLLDQFATNSATYSSNAGKKSTKQKYMSASSTVNKIMSGIASSTTLNPFDLSSILSDLTTRTQLLTLLQDIVGPLIYSMYLNGTVSEDIQNYVNGLLLRGANGLSLTSGQKYSQIDTWISKYDTDKSLGSDITNDMIDTYTEGIDGAKLLITYMNMGELEAMKALDMTATLYALYIAGLKLKVISGSNKALAYILQNMSNNPYKSSILSTVSGLEYTGSTTAFETAQTAQTNLTTQADYNAALGYISSGKTNKVTDDQWSYLAKVAGYTGDNAVMDFQRDLSTNKDNTLQKVQTGLGVYNNSVVKSQADSILSLLNSGTSVSSLNALQKQIYDTLTSIGVRFTSSSNEGKTTWSYNSDNVNWSNMLSGTHGSAEYAAYTDNSTNETYKDLIKYGRSSDSEAWRNLSLADKKLYGSSGYYDLVDLGFLSKGQMANYYDSKVTGRKMTYDDYKLSGVFDKNGKVNYTSRYNYNNNMTSQGQQAFMSYLDQMASYLGIDATQLLQYFLKEGAYSGYSEEAITANNEMAALISKNQAAYDDTQALSAKYANSQYKEQITSDYTALRYTGGEAGRNIISSYESTLYNASLAQAAYQRILDGTASANDWSTVESYYNMSDQQLMSQLTSKYGGGYTASSTLSTKVSSQNEGTKTLLQAVLDQAGISFVKNDNGWTVNGALSGSQLLEVANLLVSYGAIDLNGKVDLTKLNELNLTSDQRLALYNAQNVGSTVTARNIASHLQSGKSLDLLTDSQWTLLESNSLYMAQINAYKRGAITKDQLQDYFNQQALGLTGTFTSNHGGTMNTLFGENWSNGVSASDVNLNSSFWTDYINNGLNTALIQSTALALGVTVDTFVKAVKDGATELLEAVNRAIALINVLEYVDLNFDSNIYKDLILSGATNLTKGGTYATGQINSSISELLKQSKAYQAYQRLLSGSYYEDDWSTVSDYYGLTSADWLKQNLNSSTTSQTISEKNAQNTSVLYNQINSVAQKGTKVSRKKNKNLVYDNGLEYEGGTYYILPTLDLLTQALLDSLQAGGVTATWNKTTGSYDFSGTYTGAGSSLAAIGQINRAVKSTSSNSVLYGQIAEASSYDELSNKVQLNEALSNFITNGSDTIINDLNTISPKGLYFDIMKSYAAAMENPTATNNDKYGLLLKKMFGENYETGSFEVQSDDDFVKGIISGDDTYLNILKQMSTDMNFSYEDAIKFLSGQSGDFSLEFISTLMEGLEELASNSKYAALIAQYSSSLLKDSSGNYLDVSAAGNTLSTLYSKVSNAQSGFEAYNGIISGLATTSNYSALQSATGLDSGILKSLMQTDTGKDFILDLLSDSYKVVKDFLSSLFEKIGISGNLDTASLSAQLSEKGQDGLAELVRIIGASLDVALGGVQIDPSAVQTSVSDNFNTAYQDMLSNNASSDMFAQASAAISSGSYKNDIYTSKNFYQDANGNWIDSRSKLRLQPMAGLTILLQMATLDAKALGLSVNTMKYLNSLNGEYTTSDWSNFFANNPGFLQNTKLFDQNIITDDQYQQYLDYQASGATQGSGWTQTLAGVMGLTYDNLYNEDGTFNKLNYDAMLSQWNSKLYAGVRSQIESSQYGSQYSSIMTALANGHTDQVPLLFNLLTEAMQRGDVLLGKYGKDSQKVAQTMLQLQGSTLDQVSAMKSYNQTLQAALKTAYYKKQFGNGARDSKTLAAVALATGRDTEALKNVKKGSTLLADIVSLMDLVQDSYFDQILNYITSSFETGLNGKTIDIDTSGILLDMNGLASVTGSANIAAALGDAIDSLTTLAILLALQKGCTVTAKITKTKGAVNILWVVSDAGNLGTNYHSGGGGGGGKSKAQKLLLSLKHEDKVSLHQLKMIQDSLSYYQLSGDLAGYGDMLTKESTYYTNRNTLIDNQIKKLLDQMKTVKVGSDDWYDLRDAIYAYHELQKLNTTAIVKNTKAIRLNQQAIALTTTTLELSIQSVYELNELALSTKLSSTVNLLDLILNSIKQRYQDEWDLLQKDIEKKKEALQDEMDLIDERLNARKEAEDLYEKYEKLAEYQSQLAQIEADPTRSKDAKLLRAKIADLQELLGWDISLNLALSEKNTLQDMIDAEDEYLTLSQEDLLNLLLDANNFSGEVTTVLESSYDLIMDWFKKNDQDYVNSLKLTQLQMLDSWKDYYKSMKGLTEFEGEFYDLTNDDDREDYYSAIALKYGTKEDFLNYMHSTASYQSMSDEAKLSADIDYEDEWDNWNNAHKYENEVQSLNNYSSKNDKSSFMSAMLSKYSDSWDDLTLLRFSTLWDDYWHEYEDYLQDSSSSSSSSGSTSGTTHKCLICGKTGATYKVDGKWYHKDCYNSQSGASGNGVLAELLHKYSNTWSFTYTDSSGAFKIKTGTTLGSDSSNIIAAAASAFAKAKIAATNAQATIKAAGGTNIGTVSYKNTKKYAEGGLVDYTGPAWVDGTKSKPEAFLTSDLVVMFKQLAELMKYVRVQAPNGFVDTSSYGNTQTIGDINITINEALINDELDIQNLANQLGEQFTKQLSLNGMRLPNYNF